MIVSTTTALDGRPVTEYVGVVTGERFPGPRCRPEGHRGV
jgi:uncharacterized protein YbjQ (UPF0145 family)